MAKQPKLKAKHTKAGVTSAVFNWLKENNCELDLATGKIGYQGTYYSIDILTRLIASQLAYAYANMLIKNELVLAVDRMATAEKIDLQNKFRKVSEAGLAELDKFVAATSIPEDFELNRKILMYFIHQVKSKANGKAVHHPLMPIFYGAISLPKERILDLFLSPMNNFIAESKGLNEILVADEIAKLGKSFVFVARDILPLYNDTVNYLDITFKKELVYKNRAVSHDNISTPIGTSCYCLAELINTVNYVDCFWQYTLLPQPDMQVLEAINYDLLWECVGHDNCDAIPFDVDIVQARVNHMKLTENVYDDFLSYSCYPSKRVTALEDLYVAFRKYCGKNIRYQHVNHTKREFRQELEQRVQYKHNDSAHGYLIALKKDL